MNMPEQKKFSRARNINLDKAQEFINGAESKRETNDDAKQTSEKNNATTPEDTLQTKSNENDVPVDGEKFPWETANEKVLKGVNLRLTEVQWAKLKFIVENSPYSIQKYIMAILEPAMEKSIEQILKTPKII